MESVEAAEVKPKKRYVAKRRQKRPFVPPSPELSALLLKAGLQLLTPEDREA